MPDNPHDDARSDAFQRSLDDVLERVSDSIRAEHVKLDRLRAAHVQRAARTPSRSPAVPPITRPASPAIRRLDGRVAWCTATLFGIGAAVLWAATRPAAPDSVDVSVESLPPPAAGHAPSAPLVTLPSAGRARWPAIAIDDDATTESAMLAQLGRLAGASASDASPELAIARYDTLHALSPAWRVLAPLHVEEVYAIVPAASPLHDLGDLRGRRINVGAPGSARAMSGEALYRELFGRGLPVSTFRAASKDAALHALLGGGGLDALIYFDGQPSTWLASLPAETRARLRLLRFEPHDATSRRVLRSYLSTSVASDGGAVPTLGEVSFLVGSPRAAGARELVQALCERLPALRANGHPKWNEVDPTVQLPVNMQRAPELTEALQACRPHVTANPSSTSSSGASS